MQTKNKHKKSSSWRYGGKTWGTVVEGNAAYIEKCKSRRRSTSAANGGTSRSPQPPVSRLVHGARGGITVFAFQFAAKYEYKYIVDV